MYKRQLRICQEIFELLRCTSEVALKLVSGPFYTVLDFMGEVFQSAHRDCSRRLTTKISIAGGFAWQDCYSMRIRPLSSAVHHRLAVPDCLFIQVLPGRDVVNSSEDHV